MMQHHDNVRSSSRLRLAMELGIKLHVDGARLCNAAMVHNLQVRELCAGAESASICLSKGLRTPLRNVMTSEKDRLRFLVKRTRKR
jgi:threonine aldolase